MNMNEVLRFPGPTSDWSKCMMKSFDEDSCYKDSNLSCLKCKPNPESNCGSQMIAAGNIGCVPSDYFDDCCKPPVKVNPVPSSVSDIENKAYYNTTGGIITIVTIFVILLLLLLIFIKKYKSTGSSERIYWRR